jgi:uncharacterized protein (DUF2164 family)
MSIEVPRETQDRFVQSIRQYFAENLETEIGDLKALLLFKFILKDIAPTVYNQAVADAQARMQEMVSEIDGTCFEPEFGFWKG